MTKKVRSRGRRGQVRQDVGAHEGGGEEGESGGMIQRGACR